MRRLVVLSALVLASAPLNAFAQGSPPAAPPASADTWKDPAGAADPPLLPPPAPATPLSTSGTDIATETPVTPPAEAPGAAKQEARIAALEARLERDERELQRLGERERLWRHLKFESFLQPQLLVQSYNTAASPNLQANGQLPLGIQANDTIARADGTTTNGTFFRVRRARLRTFFETDAMRLFLQLDALPAGGVGPGIGTILRNAEATAKIRWSKQVRTEITAGLFFTPFRRELLEASLVRPWIERTWFIQNAFPTERDYGAHVKTFAFDDDLTLDLGVVNGQRLGEKTFVALPDLNRSKDFIASATYHRKFVTIGGSGYVGRGQLVDGQLLRFKQYDKWAANIEATIADKFLAVGESRLISELTFAENMDAGVNYAFAVPTIPANFAGEVSGLRQRAFYLRVEQDLLRHATLGYRFDTYTPNVSIKNNARDTHAFLAVLKISPNLRWMNELGWAIDNVHRAGAPAPSRHIVYFSTVLQAMF